ncbi:DUF63 family protein, partial [Thermococcus sp. ES12]|uniref:DUF63 family protein n=1 Tax=Thermococcus sp. ES12 TaxID=1638246 RepID=UPI001431880C
CSSDLPHPLILTPGIFFTAFILIVPAIFADSKLKTYPKITIGWGSLLALYVNYLLIINAKNWKPYELTVFYTLVFLLPILGYYRFKPFEKIYLFPVFAHIFDIGSTIVAIHYYGYREVHWLENILVQKFGAFVYYPWIVFIL